MRAPSPTWETTYAHNRRKHRHRCRCCDRIINEGERVLMVRLRGFRGNKTWALHLNTCADQPHSPGGWTWRDVFECWGTAHVQACGYPIPDHPMLCAGAVKAEAA